jgi:hypothetical protein
MTRLERLEEYPEGTVVGRQQYNDLVRVFNAMIKVVEVLAHQIRELSGEEDD